MNAGLVPATVSPRRSPATPPNVTGRARTRPQSTSLDTGQQIDIGRSKDRRDLERIARNDQAKVELSGSLRGASEAHFLADQQRSGILLSDMARKLDECRLVHAYRDATCGTYLARPRSCHVRLCPDCERSRVARLIVRLDELVGAMERPVFWTLTLPNVAPGKLKAGVDVLLEAFRAMRRRALFAGGACRDRSHACTHPRRHRAELMAECRCGVCRGCRKCVHSPVAGGVYALEVTWSKHRDWHPHIHALMDAPWITWSELRDAWRASTCDAIRRAELRATGRKGRLPRCPHTADEKGLAIGGCRGASVVWVEAVKGDPEARRSAIRETLKYVTKGLLDDAGRVKGTAGPHELAELLLAIRGRRLVAGWGTFRNVKDDDDEPLDPAEYLLGDDILPSLRGLPRSCPTCHAEAMWELPIDIPRRACRPGPDSRFLIWRPPPAARA